MTEAVNKIDSQEEAVTQDQSQSLTTDQEESTNHQPTQPTSNIIQLLRSINDDKLNNIYTNKSLYYFFLNTCVKEVVGKMKWKENICTVNYSQFVHPTDESFALLVLDNNLERYFDMIERKDKRTDANPKYTTATKKGKKNFNKGWSDEGKLKFQEYTKFVLEKRNNSTWLKDKTKYVIKRSNKENKNRKRKHKEDGEEEEDENNKKKNTINSKKKRIENKKKKNTMEKM